MSNFITKVSMAKEDEGKDLGVFVNLMIDGNFKLIMTSPKNKHILLALLNEVMPAPIRDLSLVMQEKRGRHLSFKNSVFDLDCVFEDGSQAVVEVQFNPRADYLDRMLYYSTWPITEQKHVSGKNYVLKDVYVISFCNFALVHDRGWDPGKVVSSYSIREDSNGEMMTNALHFIYVEMGRFKGRREELKSQFENFIYFLKNMGRLDSLPEGIKYEPVNDLVQAAAVESLSVEEREKYESYMRNEFDIRTEKIMAREEGFAEGEAKGLAEGEAKGKAEGLAKGKAEGLAESARMIAKKLLDCGTDIQIISKSTGLTKEEILAL